MKKWQGEEGLKSADLDRYIAEIITDAYGDNEQLRAFHDVLQGSRALPCDAFVIGEPVSPVGLER